MAQQLVYTSSPRLLQAGRTGFGTVAMHAGIPNWLQSEIEGFSQFSRLPGLDPTRVILCHTNFGQGDRKHHVFSRIHDCGADYTGRTNHIAHHFIFTAAEIAQATKLGVTPVDVLAYLNHGLWKTAWSGDPAILQPDEELPIISIPKNTITLPAINYWGHLCPDHPEYAAVLAPGKLSEACWLIYPTGWSESIIYALGESLLLHTNPWAVTFTNNLQPTDNEQLFSWRCIPSDSPLLEKATSSVRPCIDLSNPLPFLSGVPNEFLEQARTGKKPLPKPRSVETALSPLGNIPTTRPAGINIPSPTPSPRPSAPEAGPKVALRPATTKPRKQKNPAFFIASLAVASVLLIGGGYFFYQKIEADEKRDEKRESENKNTFNSWGRIPPSSNLDRNTLKPKDYENIDFFIKSFNSKKWKDVGSVVNRDFVTEELKLAMEAKIKQWQMDKYSELSGLEDPSEVDITHLKNYIEILQKTEKDRWNKAINLLNYLKDASNTPDLTVAEGSLPSESKIIEDVSRKLLATYKRKVAHKLLSEEYSKLSGLNDFNKVDVSHLKKIIDNFDSKEKAKWTKAVDLLIYLKDSSKTPDFSVTEDSLPSGSGKIKEASKILLVAYQSSPPERNPKHMQASTAEKTQDSTAVPISVVNTAPPIYVFFEKQEDYGILEPEMSDEFKSLTGNITLLTLDEKIKNPAHESENGSHFSNNNEKPRNFAVLDQKSDQKNIVVKHIVLTLNATLSEVMEDYKNNSSNLVYKIEGEKFRFREDFLKILNRLEDGKKFLTQNGEPHLNLTWKLEVTGHVFLNSNGKLSAKDLPLIKKEQILEEIRKEKEDLSKKRKGFQRKISEIYKTELKDDVFEKWGDLVNQTIWNVEFNRSQLKLPLILYKLKTNYKKNEFQEKYPNQKLPENILKKLEITQLISNLSDTDVDSIKWGKDAEKMDGKLKKHFAILELFSSNKTIGEFSGSYSKVSDKERKEIADSASIFEIDSDFFTQNGEKVILNQKSKDTNFQTLELEYKSYAFSAEKVSKLEKLNNETKADSKLSLKSEEGDFLTLDINNFPITTSELSGGQQ